MFYIQKRKEYEMNLRTSGSKALTSCGLISDFFFLFFELDGAAEASWMLWNPTSIFLGFESTGSKIPRVIQTAPDETSLERPKLLSSASGRRLSRIQLVYFLRPLSSLTNQNIATCLKISEVFIATALRNLLSRMIKSPAYLVEVHSLPYRMHCLPQQGGFHKN